MVACTKLDPPINPQNWICCTWFGSFNKYGMREPDLYLSRFWSARKKVGYWKVTCDSHWYSRWRIWQRVTSGGQTCRQISNRKWEVVQSARPVTQCLPWPHFIHGNGLKDLASSPGSLLKTGGREPGNIRGKSCQLPPPCSGNTRHFVHSAKLSTRKWTYKHRLHLKGWWKTVFGCAEEVQVQKLQGQGLL